MPFMSYAIWLAYKGNLVYIICIWQSQQQRKDKNSQFSKKVQATMAIIQLITIQSAGDFPPTKHKHKPVLWIDLPHAFSNLDRNVRFVYNRISAAKIK